ncbi:MAG: T9SS type A sorting domain-containing protein, partial [Ignavibacteriaceae bacterium]|nr:T9SS type A sorting domain-containing protein [Ignavibacteriaceae bacterium]
NTDLDAVSLELKNKYLVEDKKFQEAVNNFNMLAAKYKENPFVEKFSLFNAGFVYLKYLNDYKSALEKFNELIIKYSNDDLLAEVKYLLGVMESIPGYGTTQPKLSNGEPKQPYNFELQQNFPNPFNPTTKIHFSIAEEGQYTLRIYNILGQEVKVLFEHYLKSGSYDFNYNASDLASGVYIYQISGENKILSKKMILMR